MKFLKFSPSKLLWLLCGLSVAINVLQARYIWKLQVEDGQLFIKGPLHAGAVVPDLKVLDLSGKLNLISYGDSSKVTVIYFFQPHCTWCQRNSAAINELASRLSGRYRLLGLSPVQDGLAEFLSSHHVTFPVYTGFSRSSLASYHLGSTPETIAIAPGGVVLGSWDGAYIGPTKTAVEHFFSISLSASSGNPN